MALVALFCAADGIEGLDPVQAFQFRTDDDDDDDDVYYPKGRRPREDEEGEESYEKQRQRPGKGG